MAWNTGGAQRANLNASGIQIVHEDMFDLASRISVNDEPRNFIVSGQGGKDDAYRILSGFIASVLGRWPLVILHNGDPMVENVVGTIWKSAKGESKPCDLFGVNQQYRDFEPLYGLDEMESVRVLKALAAELGYAVTPRFETVVRAHLGILRDLGIPASLSGLSFLCSFEDLGEFHENVLALPSGSDYGRRIWAALGADGNDQNSQFDLFRAVVSNLALEASHCGWNPDKQIATCNARVSIGEHAAYVHAIDNSYSQLILPYIVEELRGAPSAFVIVLWDIRVDETLRNFLTSRSDRFRFGIFDHNVVDALGGEDAFGLIAEQAHVDILLKHGTSSTAMVLSEMMGKYDAVRIDEAAGSSRRFFGLLPSSREKTVSVTTENRYRVMPEDITSLSAGQAIVFDSDSNSIVYNY